MHLNAMATYVAEFKHQSVRDLAWAVSSPPVISQPSQSCLWPDARWYRRVYEESLPWLHKIDEDPSELVALFENQKDRRLGKVFESLWFYWFSHHPRYEMIESNIQIIVDGETLGEIDFIVLDKVTKQMVHWEVAVKFYLGVGETSEMSNWYGPNCHDRLDIKVRHMMQRQSMVGKDQRVRQWLKQKGLFIDQCAVILKGRLYYPWNSLMENSVQDAGQLKPQDLLTNLRSPPQCSSNHMFSWWFNESQFDREFDNKQCFVPLIKQGWMENISTFSEDDLYTKNSLFKTISDNKLRLPLQVQICNPCHSWDRVFLVDEKWPATTS